MRYITQRWSPQNDGILYFFQRLEEMLFHYSSDIVRAPIHNSRTLILEYLQNEEEMKRGRVKAYQIDQILNELRDSIGKDKILSKNLGQQFIETIVKELPLKRGDLIRYMNNKIPERTYLVWAKKYLLEHCGFPSHKDEIECGLRSWVVEIISRGHSPEYIYKHLQAEMSKPCTDPSRKFQDFIDHFSLDKKIYRVYFVFSSILSDCKESFKQLMNVSFENDGAFDRIKIHKNDFIGYVDMDSYDRYTAVGDAYSKVSPFLKYYRVISNRKKDLVGKFCIVRTLDDQVFYQLPVKSSGYRSIELEPKVQLSNAIDGLMLACGEKPKETNIPLNKSIELHDQAIRQHDLNDGFVNLWSILEVICADTVGESKIEKVINGVVPILQKDYFAALHENINDDLKDNLSRNDYESLLANVLSKHPHTDPIAQFIYLPDFEELRKEYFQKLQAFPIIRAKIYRLWSIRGNAAAALGLSTKYAQRIKWHLYRLYRTRNAIVHSGDTHQRIQMLGEHLHIYVDRILNEIMLKLAIEDTLQTITDVLIDTKMLLNKTQTSLSTNNPITKDLIDMMCESYFYLSSKQYQ